MKVLILGYGNMGKTNVNSFISSRFIKTGDICLAVRTISKAVLEKENPSI